MRSLFLSKKTSLSRPHRTRCCSSSSSSSSSLSLLPASLLLSSLLLICCCCCWMITIPTTHSFVVMADPPQPPVRQQQHRAAASASASGSSPAAASQLNMAASGESNKSSNSNGSNSGRLEELKKQEAILAAQLAAIRQEKLSTIRSRPLTIGIVGFGRFGRFIAQTFAKYGRVVVTSRSDYTDIATSMGVKYIPLTEPDQFLAENLDVIVFCVSIMSFEPTVKTFIPHLVEDIKQRAAGDTHRAPLIVDVLSVKEHPRQVLLDLLPPSCDILCTHPMFGPDSGKNGWQGLNFVYEKTRIDNVVLLDDPAANQESFVDAAGQRHSIHENSEAHVEGMDRMERFLSIWEEEGCRMVPMSCAHHDAYAANSQFITHLVGRVLGSQGLAQTPIDTSGFQSVLKLIDSTTADSFDLFYGLYKYNQNSLDTIQQLQGAMAEVVERLHIVETGEQEKKKPTAATAGDNSNEKSQQQQQQQQRPRAEEAEDSGQKPAASQS